MTVRARPSVRLPSIALPPPDLLSTGAGLLIAAVLLLLPAIAGEPLFPPDLEVGGVPLRLALVAGAVLIAIAGVADLVGRTELRQGVAILGFGGLAIGVLLLLTAVGDALAEPPVEGALDVAPFALVLIWASALAVGTITFGPTRAAVLIGLATMAIALLLPAPPDGKPYLETYLTGGPSSLLLVGGILGAAIWRLLDLPFVGGILLGGGLFIATLYLGWPSMAAAEGATAPAGMFTTESLDWLIGAAAAWVGLGAMFGRPAPG
jgi:hypothetical protein